MAVNAATLRRYSAATALRGLFMLIAGLYATFLPTHALGVLVVAAGLLLIVDAILGLWSLTFGGGKSGNYWFDVAANAVSLILGVVILISPLLATIFTATLLAVLAGIAAIVVGGMQIVVILRERGSYARVWPVVLSGIAYVLLGLVFFFFPVLSVTVSLVVGGVLLVIYAFGLFGWALRLWQRAKETPA